MARISIQLPEEQLAQQLARIATHSGRSQEEIASALVAQASDPWARAWAIIEEARGELRVERSGSRCDRTRRGEVDAA